MESAQFNFFIQREKSSPLSNKKILEKLMQWSMKGNIRIKHYNFNQHFHPYQKQEFVNAFFKDPNVYSTLETFQTSTSCWCPIGDIVEKVDYEFIPSSEISMSFFERLLDPNNGILREGGEIRQSMEDEINGFVIPNQLRVMLLDENSELYNLYSRTERNEFIFRLFLHLVLGGQWCQWDDTIQSYLDVTQVFYKELMSVEKEEGTSKIRIRSVILRVNCLDGKGKPVFPSEPENIQDFCYLIIDPFKRSLTTFSHSYAANFTV